MRSSLSEFIADNRKELEVIGDNSGRLRDSFVSLAATFSSIFETMQKLSDRAEKSKQLLGSIAHKIGAGNGSLESLDGAMGRINMNSAKMNEIISVINDISDRINLLSLNASIEAARAGEAGKGFAVVATEIGGLASQSANTVKEIQNITQSVMDAVHNLADSATQLLDFVKKDVTDDLNTFNKTTEDYIKDINYYDQIIQQFRKVAEELKVSVESISNSINDVSKASEEGAKGTTDIASRSTEMSNYSQNVLEKVRLTQSAADKLNIEVSAFKVE